MLTWCEKCGHSLWSEVGEARGVRFLLYFDDDERSVMYAEHVTQCPNCGFSLVENALQAIASEARTPVGPAEGSYIGDGRRPVR